VIQPTPALRFSNPTGAGQVEMAADFGMTAPETLKCAVPHAPKLS
jgi:hypothetical protein